VGRVEQAGLAVVQHALPQGITEGLVDDGYDVALTVDQLPDLRVVLDSLDLLGLEVRQEADQLRELGPLGRLVLPALLHQGKVILGTAVRLLQALEVRLVDLLEDLVACERCPRLESVAEHLPEGHTCRHSQIVKLASPTIASFLLPPSYSWQRVFFHNGQCTTFILAVPLFFLISHYQTTLCA
jgi:hypothetical protein